MGADAESDSSSLDVLWNGVQSCIREFDDLTLARWMAQTLGQLEGKAWRLSHPLVGAYRLAAQQGYSRQVWFKRLATPPHAYAESPCCRAPMLPLLTRDVEDGGLLCVHCNDVLVQFEDLPKALKEDLSDWVSQYQPVHAVAHWDDRQRRSCGRGTTRHLKRPPTRRSACSTTRDRCSLANCWNTIPR